MLRRYRRASRHGVARDVRPGCRAADVSQRAVRETSESLQVALGATRGDDPPARPEDAMIPWKELDRHEKPLVVSVLCVVILGCLWALFG
jgi:hypothetical protein